jgi:hypothetical protein
VLVQAMASVQAVRKDAWTEAAGAGGRDTPAVGSLKFQLELLAAYGNVAAERAAHLSGSDLG